MINRNRIVVRDEGMKRLIGIVPALNVECPRDADGTLREYYTRGIGIAGDVGSLIAETRFENNAAVSTTYLHSNWRGDVVMAADTSGNVVGEYAYTTFGEQLSSVGSFVPRFTFSSKERDASGLVYHGFRYYSPVLCRWISEDPIREGGGFNLYQFCGNDPVNGIDPYGEFTLSEWKEIGGAFAEGFGKGIAAGVDGMIPFVDPFTGVYADDCGNVNNMYRVSRHIGGFTRDAMIAVAIPNIGTWVKNPVMYEIGQTTVSPATWNTIKGLSAIDRGKYLVNSANGNYLKAALGGLGNFGQFGTTIGTGLTPGGNLLMLGGFEFVDYQTR
jgi:RHS repeat-associated protein